MKEKISIVGKKFNHLTVIERVYPTESKRYIWYKCKCDCGKYTVTRKDSIISGHATSCGCQWEKIRNDGSRTRKHGLYKSRIYALWHKVKDRCVNENCKEYFNYGGRGIKMCDEWLNDPKAFSDWCYANGYDDTSKKGVCTLDRIDVEGNYEPSNCRFITNKEQQNNRRDNIYAEHNGERLTIAEWRDRLGLTYSCVRYHCYTKGKPIQWLIDNYPTKMS